MKLHNDKKTFESSVDQSKSLEFGIGDASVVIEILRNRLYEQKIQTSVQEYVSNARDAHREFNQTRPIEINVSSTIFEVRDFGPGVSPDRMANVFVLYGASTKRNNNNQVGGWGIGAKSAWAYTDSFTITTFIDGVQRIYVAHTGANNNGRLDLLSESDTDEPNGTKITISIKRSDLDEFKSAIIRATMFWNDDEYPIITGIDNSILQNIRNITTQRFMGMNLVLDNYMPLPYGMDLRIRDKRYLVIDGIPYSAEVIDSNCYRELGGYLLNQGFYLHVPTGLISISASREKLDNTESNKKAVGLLYEDLNKQFRANLEKLVPKDITDEQIIDFDRQGLNINVKGNYLYRETDKITFNKNSVNYINERCIDATSSKLANIGLTNTDVYFMYEGEYKIKDIRDWLYSKHKIIDLIIIQNKERKLSSKYLKNFEATYGEEALAEMLAEHEKEVEDQRKELADIMPLLDKLKIKHLSSVATINTQPKVKSVSISNTDKFLYKEGDRETRLNIEEVKADKDIKFYFLGWADYEAANKGLLEELDGSYIVIPKTHKEAVDELGLPNFNDYYSSWVPPIEFIRAMASRALGVDNALDRLHYLSMALGKANSINLLNEKHRKLLTIADRDWEIYPHYYYHIGDTIKNDKRYQIVVNEYNDISELYNNLPLLGEINSWKYNEMKKDIAIYVINRLKEV